MNTEITRSTRRPITKELKTLAREDGWSEQEIERGYGYFNTELGIMRPYNGPSEGCRTLAADALHIECIGIMGVFDSDKEAALYGEKFYGEKLLHYELGEDEEISLFWFKDEPKTREAIANYLEWKYGPEHNILPAYETVKNPVYTASQQSKKKPSLDSRIETASAKAASNEASHGGSRGKEENHENNNAKGV